MWNFQSICKMCINKLVAKYPKYNMQATCASVVHVLRMCRNSEKKPPWCPYMQNVCIYRMCTNKLVAKCPK